MTERVVHSSKPNGTANAATGVPVKPAVTATPVATAANPRPQQKAQAYNPYRNPYRQAPPATQRRRSRRPVRRCLCRCCLWSILILVLILLLAAIAGCIFYLLYHPHRPTFSVTALRTAQLNLTAAADDSTSTLLTRLNLTISAKNPNKKFTFIYSPITITSTSYDTQIANGTYPATTTGPETTTIIKTTISGTAENIDSADLDKLKSDLKKKGAGIPMVIELDTESKVKFGKVQSKKVGVRITCGGVQASVPKGNSTSAAAKIPPGEKCKVEIRIKILGLDWKI